MWNPVIEWVLITVWQASPQKDINVVGGFITRTLHLLEAPVPAFAGDLKRHQTVSLARLPLILIANPGNDLALKDKVLGVNTDHASINFNVVPTLSLPAFNEINSAPIGYRQVG